MEAVVALFEVLGVSETFSRGRKFVKMKRRAFRSSDQFATTVRTLV